ncbi:Caf20p KNAG_0G02870 [Huiozyma naganishii CBS 8797]|uniref:Cap-associated protein CAF20 n=1 Tax=Huiozyma naganishii (strain ATCC MYA-139 / BCRC 22969 / CBS 8797 / KCTC 17520 / NBRC 10181 / NCYC 3082 / Yp74L-3) TaxID=1071383 RepID=J7S846_HUIN7|nr:hypothetical protein KNAG_0G02870 [Kazachstania naganishii CBS 8797]CCK71344.1 hypothetical protein KNAG_0G02870 [Kazachstania naganishii CBS 8797]
MVTVLRRSYTIDELFQLKPAAAPAELAVNFDAVEFCALVAKVKEIQAAREEEYMAHNGGRRRSSHHFAHTRPKVKHMKPKVKTDEDGWSTFEPKMPSETDLTEGNKQKSSDSLTAAQENVRVRPNNKNMGSSRPADAKDIIADKQILGFNAFAALESESESDNE